MAAGEFSDEITPVEVTQRSLDLGSGEVGVSTRTVNLDEGALARTAEALEETLGTLDGKLSLLNATTYIDLT